MKPRPAAFEPLSLRRLATCPELGGKARRLAAALRAGLPVPEAFVVWGAAWSGATPATRAGWAQELGSRLEQGPVAVRSAFPVEDGSRRSLAGAFRTELGIPIANPVSLVAAIDRVQASAGRVAEPVAPAQRDVLVQAQVAAVHAGVAFTEPDFADDLVEFVDGRGDALVSGRRAGLRVELPKPEAGGSLTTARELSVAERACIDRLRLLLSTLRRRFGAGETGWDVEWADDGRTCWLLQCRPVTRSPGRDELFTVANHKEILPDPPSRLMASMMAERAVQLYGWYRRLDPGLPSNRPFLELFHGRPRINLSLLIDTMRRFGLPTRLVTDSIGTGGEVGAVPLRPWTMLRRAPVLLRMGYEQIRAARVARRTARRIRGFPLPAEGCGFGPLSDALGDAYVALVHAMFGATAAMSVPLAVLRRLDVLHEHSRRHRSVTSRLFLELDRLRAALRSAPAAVREELRAGRWPTDDDWRQRVARLVERHGHRGPFESDVASPRFGERPAPLLRSLGAEGGDPHRSPDARTQDASAGRRLRRLCTMPLWWIARGPLAAREELRDQAMHGFAALRAGLLREAQRAVADGRLPEVEAVFLLSVEELRAVDRGRRIDRETLDRRRKELAEEANVWLPDVGRRRELRAAVGASEAAAVAGREVLQGLGLGRGSATGVAWVAQHPEDEPPIDPESRPLVLVAAAVDAGWIPLMSRAVAVVVDLGGELSHGSIVLRELGIPAVTDTGCASRSLVDGQWLRVDAARGRVESLPASPSPSRDTEQAPESSQPRPSIRPNGTR